MTIRQIREIGDAHHKDMVEMGWSDPKKTDAHYKMLVIDEVCEAIQSHRKGNVRGNISEEVDSMMDKGEFCDQIFMNLFERYHKDTVTDELADAFLRLLSLAWMRGYGVVDDIYIPPISEKSMFTETAWGFVRMLVGAESDRVAVQKGILFIRKWCEVLKIDLYHACKRKMRYNQIRNDWKNGEKKY